MKKIISILLIFSLLLLCSCKSEEPESPKSSDMLNITNTDKTFLGCKSRLDAVLSAMSSKINILENAHNNMIKMENSEEYFLDKSYILTSFEPFVINSAAIIEGFNENTDNKNAQEIYKTQGNGKDITFSSSGENYELLFVSENKVETYTAEYDEENDSFKYVYTVENSGEETVEEFIEFSKTESGAYLIQSRLNRCYIEFDENGNIIYFCCGTLNEGEFSPEESIYPSAEDEEIDEFWVINRGKKAFSSIHTFDNNILTHEDRSSGPWKTVRISADDYASAFYGQ